MSRLPRGKQYVLSVRATQNKAVKPAFGVSREKNNKKPTISSTSIFAMWALDIESQQFLRSFLRLHVGAFTCESEHGKKGVGCVCVCVCVLSLIHI